MYENLPQQIVLIKYSTCMWVLHNVHQLELNILIYNSESTCLDERGSIAHMFDHALIF